MPKISLFYQFIPEKQPFLESYDKSSHTQFWTCSPLYFFNLLSIFMILYQHAKNQAFTSFSRGIEISCSRDIVDLEILQSDWLRAFCFISQKPNSDQIQKKLIIKFFNKYKEPYVWSIFGPFSLFWEQK